MANSDKKTNQANEEVDLAAQMDSLLTEINQKVPDLGVQVSGPKTKTQAPAAKPATGTKAAVPASAGATPDDQLGAQLSQLMEEAQLGDTKKQEVQKQEESDRNSPEMVSQAANEQSKDLAGINQDGEAEQSEAKGGVLKPIETTASASEAASAGGSVNEDDVEASLVSDAISLATQLQELLTEVKTQGLGGDTPHELAEVLPVDQGHKVDGSGSQAEAEAVAAEPAPTGDAAGLPGLPSGDEAGNNIEAADQVTASGSAIEAAAASSPIIAESSLPADVLVGATGPLPDEPKTIGELDEVLLQNAQGLDDEEAEHTESLMKLLAAKRQALSAGLTGSNAAASAEDKIARPLEAVGAQAVEAVESAPLAEATPAQKIPDIAAVIADAAAGIEAAADEPAGTGSGVPRSGGGATAADVARELDSQPELKSAGGTAAVTATLVDRAGEVQSAAEIPATGVPTQPVAQAITPPAPKAEGVPASAANLLATGDLKPAPGVTAGAVAAPGVNSTASPAVKRSILSNIGPRLKMAIGKLKPKPGDLKNLKQVCITRLTALGPIICKILWLTNKPLGRMPPLTRNAIGYVGLVTLFNGVLLLIGKLISMTTGGH